MSNTSAAKRPPPSETEPMSSLYYKQ